MTPPPPPRSCRRPHAAAATAVAVLCLAAVGLSRGSASLLLLRGSMFALSSTSLATGASAWTPLAALVERSLNVSGEPPSEPPPPPAPGCPPPPRLCRLQDVFDEVLVISLPRFAARARRITAQLEALGAPHTLVHANDARAVGAAAGAFSGELGSPGVFALWLTHLAVLGAAARAPPVGRARSVLLLEDDATFAADFPTAFDSAARALPHDWRTFFLGQSIYWHDAADAACAPRGSPLAPRTSSRCASVYGAFAVGFSREAAALVLSGMLAARSPIDLAGFEAEWALHGNASLLALPPLVAMQQYGSSTLEHCWAEPPWVWKRHNMVAAERFDLLGPGYVRGGAPAPAAPVAQCSDMRVLVGTRIIGADICSGRVRADSAQACCRLCVASFPACTAWTFDAGSSSSSGGGGGGGGEQQQQQQLECTLKSSATHRERGLDLAVVSAELDFA